MNGQFVMLCRGCSRRKNKKKLKITQLDLIRGTRKTWTINPVTKIIKDKTKYDRKREKTKIIKEINQMNIVIQKGNIKYSTKVKDEKEAGAILCEGFIKHISTGFNIFLNKYHFEGFSEKLTEDPIYTFNVDSCTVTDIDGNIAYAGDFLCDHTAQYGNEPVNPDISMY